MKTEFSFADKNILIVEDQKPFQVMLKGMLKNMGARNVVVSPNGEQALVRCTEEKFDVIFIDYNLGEGRNGRQLFEELKERKLLPVHNVSMLVTGESELNMVIGAVEVRPDDYVVKPFSQNLLKQRVSRNWLKKQTLLPLLTCLDKNQLDKALLQVDELSKSAPRLRTLILKYKADILFKLGKFVELDAFLDQVLKVKSINWALVYKSKLMRSKGKHSLAIRYSKDALSLSKLTIEAYDIIADCYLKNSEKKPAYDWIRSGIEKSPFSVQRQYKLSSLAKLNKDFDVSIKACNQVVELTSKSFRRDQKHLLNHIRNIIDICELEQDVNKKRKYNQEAIYALQKSKHEQHVNAPLKIEDFEQICMARLDSVNGLNYQAKRSFFELAAKFTDRKLELPSNLLPDSVSLMLKIGEYEKAKEYAQKVEMVKEELDDYAIDMITQAQVNAGDNIELVKSLNKKGIEDYHKGEFHNSYKYFDQALNIAPMNSGTALNLIQVLISLIESEPKSRWEHIDKCRFIFKIIDGMPLSKANSKRAMSLAEKFNTLITEPKK